MSEEKKQRTVAEIQQEYTSICARAGHLQYQLYTVKEDLATINKTLRDLNVEGAVAQRAEQEALAKAQKETAEKGESEPKSE